MASSPIYLTIFNAVLDPSGKMAYFKKNWPENLHSDVLATAEKIVSCRKLVHYILG